MIKTSRARSLSALSGTVILFSALAVAVTGSPAQAGCSHPHSNIDSGSERVKSTSGTSSTAIRSGPHSGCGRVVAIPNGKWVTYDCYTNDGDNVGGYESWTWVRYSDGTRPMVQGWIPDYNLRDLGAETEC
jgi:hypothetical protein